MRPLTDKIPKPLLAVGKQPFLAYLISFLKKQGIEEFILTTGYKAEMIENYFGSGRKFGAKIIYSREDVPLDTGGPIKKAENLIKGENILILNGDSFIDFDLKKMTEFHQKMKKPATLAVVKVKNQSRSGQITIDKNSIITRFKEKEKEKGEGFINAGVYIFQKDLLSSFPRDKKISLEKDIFPKLEGNIAAFKNKGYFIDIGAKEDYLKFNKDIKKIRIC